MFAITRVHPMLWLCCEHCKNMPHICQTNDDCQDTIAESAYCIFPSHINGIHKPVNSFIQQVFVSEHFFNMLKLDHCSHFHMFLSHLHSVSLHSSALCEYMEPQLVSTQHPGKVHSNDYMLAPPNRNFVNASYTKTTVKTWTHGFH
jgi:hypothetical protein